MVDLKVEGQLKSSQLVLKIRETDLKFDKNIKAVLDDYESNKAELFTKEDKKKESIVVQQAEIELMEDSASAGTSFLRPRGYKTSSARIQSEGKHSSHSATTSTCKHIEGTTAKPDSSNCAVGVDQKNRDL